MPEEINECIEAQNAFARKLASTPPQSKEEAEILALEAEAFVSLATAEKTRMEIGDAVSTSTRLQRWIQFSVGIVGFTGTIAGAIGTLYFMEQYHEREAAIELKEENLKKAEADLEAEVEIVKKQGAELEKVKEERDRIRDNIRFSLEIDEALNLENQRTKNELKQQSADIDQKNNQITQISNKLLELKAQQEEEEDKLEDTKTRSETLATQYDQLREAIDNLPKKTLNAIAAEKNIDPDLERVIAEALRNPKVPQVPPAELNEFSAKAEKLFDPKPGVRGAMYTELTTGKDRTSQALLNALLQLGAAKYEELKTCDLNSIDPEEKKKVALLRRGLENVVVTIRDMSRTVTKKPQENREKVLAFARELEVHSYGVGEEAASLRKWLED